MKTLKIRNLTLEEILDLEADIEFWNQLKGQEKSVPIYNINRKSSIQIYGENKPNFHTSSIYTGDGRFYFVLQVDINKNN